MVLKTPVVSTKSDSPDLASIKQSVESRLSVLLPQPDLRDSVAAAMRDCALAPGKRLRPLLLILTASDLGHSAPAVLDIACAVEMVHAASLVLDDMPCMDNAALRRGLPTTHVAYGEDIAILAAVALLSQAFRTVASAPGVTGAVRADLVLALSEAVGTQGLVRGQFEDLREGAQSRTPDQIAATNTLKTSMLFRVAVDMAAIMAQANHAVRLSLRRFADELGQAYQLLDDIKDYGDAAVEGKDIGKDVGKSTLIGVLGIGAGRLRLADHVAQAHLCIDDACGGGNAIHRLLNTMFPAELPEHVAPSMDYVTGENRRLAAA